jgi:DNA-binding NtrC family response regulator
MLGATDGVPPNAASPETVLIVDDDDLVRTTLSERFRGDGYEVVDAASGAECLERVASLCVDAVLLDYRLPDQSGLELLRAIKREQPDAAVVMLTGHSSVGTAVEAMKEGAFHYLSKPIDLDQVANVVRRALESTRLKREVRNLRRAQDGGAGLEHILGKSAAIERVKELIQKIAMSPASTVLITGESGTGKDVTARAIHAQSERADGPFTNITCSALPEPLLESELFGHEKGSFTGAHSTKRGLLELSHGGTVFLDEIGEMAPGIQAKLLRFLESKTFRRVGGARDFTPNVRIVAATNRDLRAEVQGGNFREDLYYRLSVLTIHLPSLRERMDDLPVLASHFVESFNREFGKDVQGISPPTMEALKAYGWPGNVRELRNAVERAVLLAEGGMLTTVDFELLGSDAGGKKPVFELPPEGIDLEDIERSFVMQALRRTRGNQTRAGKLLGLNRDQIRYRLAKFGWDKTEFSDETMPKS